MKRMKLLMPVLALMLMCMLSACKDEDMAVLNNKSGEDIRYVCGTFHTPSELLSATDVLSDTLVLKKDSHISLELDCSILDAGGYFQIAVVKQSTIDENGADNVKANNMVSKRFLLTKNNLEDLNYVIDYTGNE